MNRDGCRLQGEQACQGRMGKHNFNSEHVKLEMPVRYPSRIHKTISGIEIYIWCFSVIRVS